MSEVSTLLELNLDNRSQVERDLVLVFREKRGPKYHYNEWLRQLAIDAFVMIDHLKRDKERLENDVHRHASVTIASSL